MAAAKGNPFNVCAILEPQGGDMTLAPGVNPGM